MEYQDHQANQVHLVKLAHRDSLEVVGTKVIKDLQARKEAKGYKDQEVKEDAPANLEIRDNLDQPVKMDTPEKKVFPDRPVYLVLQDFPVHVVHPVLLVAPEKSVVKVFLE